MANLDQLMTALENASKNGNTEDAKKLAQIIEQTQRGPTNSDILAGMADSALRIGKGLVDLPITLTEAATGVKNPRLLVGNDKKGFQWEDLTTAPRFVSADEADKQGYKANPLGFTGDEFKDASNAIQETREDINYAPNVSWDEVKENPSAQNIATFIGEGTLTSLPDMAAAMVSVPAYFASYIAPIAQERAENDGREVVTPKDVGAAILASGVIATAERFGAKGVFGKTAGNAVTRPLKAGTKEGVTEAIQNPVEYAGETLGTETSFDTMEALDRAAAGAVQGTGGGAGLKTITQVPEIAKKRLEKNDAPVDAEAAAELAQDIQAKAEEGNFDLSDPDTTSSTGAYRAVDNLHVDYATRMRSLESILGEQIKNDKKDTPSIRANKEKAQAGLRKAKNKAKNTVDPNDLQALDELVGSTAEGQELMRLMRKTNELTRLHNGGYKGGVSRITDTFNPFAGGSQYNAGRIAAGPIIAMTTGATAFGTGGMSLPYQVGAVLGGKAIDKYTGRGSVVERYTKQNIDQKGTKRVKRPSKMLIENAKEAQRIEAKRLEDERKLAKAENDKQLRIEALRRGDPPKGDPNDANPSPEYRMMQSLGTNDRRKISDLLDEVAKERPRLKPAVQSYQSMLINGTPVLNINELIRAAKNAAGIDSLTGPEGTQQAQQGQQQLSARQEDGKRANQKAVEDIIETVNSDKTIDKTDKAKLGKALTELQSNLGKKPVEKALEIIANVEKTLNRPSLADQYLTPYLERIAFQQGLNKNL